MDLYVIFIGIVIVVVDELVDVIKCNGKGDCQGGICCLIYILWCDFSLCIMDFFNNIMFGELMMDNEVFEVLDC